MLAQPPQQWYNSRFNNTNNVRPQTMTLPNQQLGMNPLMWNSSLPNPNFTSMTPRGNLQGRVQQRLSKPISNNFENWRVSQKMQDMKKSTPFVPLQAQKQNRSINKTGNDKQQKELGRNELSERKSQQNVKEHTHKVIH